MELTATALAILATIGFSVVVPLVATSTKRIGAVATMFLFQGLGIPLFALLVPVMPPIPPETHIRVILTIGVAFTFVYLLFLRATKIGTVAVVSTVNQLYMVVTTLLGVWLLGESFTIWKILGLCLMFIGVLLLGFQKPTKKISSIQLLAGVPHALFSAFGTGIYLFSIAMTSRTDGWFLTALFIRVAITLTSFVVLLIRKYNFSSLQKNAPWKLLLFAAVCDVGAFSLYNYVISAYEVSTITIITASQAAVIALLSWKFLKERLTLQQVIGIGVVLGGLISLQLQ